MACIKVFCEVEVPHHANGSRAPSATVISPCADLWLTARRIRITSTPKVLFKFVLSIDKNMMCSLKELSGIAGVETVVGTTTPVMACSGDFQLGCHSL